jgi:tetratricopeptide (TPR) repeat protein
MRKILLAAVLVIPTLARAAPTTADDWYKEAAKQYTLGNYEKAAEAFKHAYELEPDETKQPAYLYNIAQSYRQANDCVKAQFFYKRFLATKPNDKVKSDKERKTAEDFIKDLEPCAQQAATMGRRPPETLQSNNGAGPKDPPPDTREHKEVATTTPPPETDGEHDTGVEPAPGKSVPPRLLSARITGGGTKVYAGSIPVPVQATFAGMVGYPVPINDKLTVEVGAAGTLTAIPYSVMAMPSASQTAYLISAMADAGATYEVMPKLGARVDIGLGALFFSNVNKSPFVAGAEVDGTLTMFHFRAAVSADYAITPNFVVTATPLAFSYSPPKTGLDKSIGSLASIDFLIGLGYRM